MKDTPKCRKNVCAALLANVDAGKTTLSEGLLYAAGKIRRLGRVDAGDCFLDTYDLERERGITIFSKQAALPLDGMDITLLDTPGHVDFSAEMERTLQVLDYAVLVISGADGVQGHTETLWRLLAHYQIPVFIFVNKMDQPGLEKEKLMEDIRDRLDERAVDFSDTSDTDFQENAALLDEDVLNRYLEEGELDLSCLPSMIRKRKIVPCFFGSALRMQGVEEFLQALETYMQCPVYPDEFGARVFKIMRDEKGNRLTFMKVTGGVLRVKMELCDEEAGWREKVNQIRMYSGGRFETAESVEAGTICAVTGLGQTYPGEGLGMEGRQKRPLLEPVQTYRIVLPQGCEAAVMLPKFRLLEEEMPELHLVWREELQEIQAQVMGKVQLEILQRMIKDRYGVAVDFDRGRIMYRETIAGAVEGIGHFEPLRHYAEVHLWMEPGEPGSGLLVSSGCSEDMLAKNWQRLILSHVLEREHAGVLTGSPLTDVRVTLIAGRAHLKHTEGGDFRQATYRAIRHGLMQAPSVLLEPYYEYRLEVPDAVVGRAMTDVERMSGRFSVEQGRDGMSILTGEVPVSTMQDYAGEVAVYTKGKGRLSCVPAGYRPCHNADEVIRELGYDAAHDTENPASSVFCAHGSGFTVEWEKVREYAHVDVDFRMEPDGDEEEDEEEPLSSWQKADEALGTEEIDEILLRASHANKNRNTSTRRSSRPKVTGLSKPGRVQKKQGRFLLVDGYNIIFSWKELKELAAVGIDSARGRLMDILCNYQGYENCQVILVFDAYRVQNHPTETFSYHNIQVVYTREAETADSYIEKFAHENAKKYHITVATSDGLEQIIIRGEGCRLLSAADLEGEIRRVEKEIQEFNREI